MLLLLLMTMVVSGLAGQEATGEEMQEYEKVEMEEEEVEDVELGDGERKCPSEAFGNLCIEGNYMRLMAPTALKDGGTVVNVSMTVHGITEIDSFKHSIALELSLTMSWLDHRIEWKKKPKINRKWSLDTRLFKYI